MMVVNQEVGNIFTWKFRQKMETQEGTREKEEQKLKVNTMKILTKDKSLKD